MSEQAPEDRQLERLDSMLSRLKKLLSTMERTD